MTRAKVIVAFLITSFSAIPSVAQKSSGDFEAVVLPITDVKVGLNVETKSGTGFCLDLACQFIGTNYHVAMIARPRKIDGQTVVQRYLATGPEDEGATVNESVSMPSMKYSISKDLAIFELCHPLRNRHGLAFYRSELQIGQQVDIYSYPKESMIRFRKLLQVHGTFKGQTPSGLLAFDYVSDGRGIRPGASGGIVVDRKTGQIVGVLNAAEPSGKTIVLAVPVDSLEEFVSRVQPYLAQSIFPSNKRISPLSQDIYPKFVLTFTNALQHRPEESIQVQDLRVKAQRLADGMQDFVAVQTFSWGSQNNEPLVEAKYEVRVLDGYQRFREFPDGKKELQDVPIPPLNSSIGTDGAWAELPAKVGTNLNLRINQAPDVVLNGRSVKVFQYEASIEDGVCALRSVVSFDFFTLSKIIVAACYGEVWTDEDLNILRMSEHFELFGRWKNFQTVVTYGWLKKADEVPRLVPLTIATQAEYKKKIHWCRGVFTDYQVFTSRARIVASTDGVSRPSGDEKRR
jgi:hypothetical protein